MNEPVQEILARRSGRSVRRQQTTAAVVAFLIHALLVTAAYAVPRLTRSEREFPEYVAVHVMPSAALGPERPTPPAPAPEPPPPAPEPEPQPAPEPVPPPPPKPDPEIPVLPREEPEAKQPPAPRPAPAPQPAEPAPDSEREGTPRGSSAGGSYLGAQVVGDAGAAFPYDYYLDQMLGKIRQSWMRPPVEGIEAVITFRVLRNGEIADVEIRESSGSRAFDLSALRAVRNASPLPPLPASFREDLLTVNLIVR